MAYGLDALPGDLFEANAYLDICPPSLQDTSAAEPAERIPLRPVAPIGPTDGLPAWIGSARSRPLVYLTLGTYVSGHVGSLRAAAAGLGALDVDALVTVGPDGDPSALGPLPGSVRVPPRHSGLRAQPEALHGRHHEVPEARRVQVHRHLGV